MNNKLFTKDFLRSHVITVVLVIIAILVLVMGAFSVGERVGYHKASFAFQNGNNFYQTFGPRLSPMMERHDFPDAHGTAGKIVSIALPAVVIEDKDGTEKTIVTSDQTVIRRFRDALAAKDLAVGDDIVAIGEPNAQSQIAATLIRLLPPPPANN